MPIYEYECRGCGKTFEVYQKHSDPPPAKHECGSADLQRVMSRTSFVLKGTGWYLTDYARKEKKDSGSGDKGDKGASDKGDKGASDKGDKGGGDKGDKGGGDKGDKGEPKAGRAA